MIQNTNPVVIGGVGGSGTRIVASALDILGFTIGNALNRARDNLHFSFLFRHSHLFNCDFDEFSRRMNLFAKATAGEDFTSEDMSLIEQIFTNSNNQSANWLRESYGAIRSANKPFEHGNRFAFKEPNTWVFVHHLFRYFGSMKYIFVRRSGLDMAYSQNKNQLALWGDSLGCGTELTPENALEFWCRGHLLFEQLTSGIDESLVLKLNYEELVNTPESAFANLGNFLGIDISPDKMASLKDIVENRGQIGRSNNYSLSRFKDKYVHYVESQGFAVQTTASLHGNRPPDIFRPDSLLGYRLSPSSEVTVPFREPKVVQHTNALGWRVVTGDTHHPDNRVLSLYGCSFTYGTGLRDCETFSSQIQKEIPNWSVVNRGVGGHSTVQNYLQFCKDIEFDNVDAALFCVISDHRYRNTPHPVRMKAFTQIRWCEAGIEFIPTATFNREGHIQIRSTPIVQRAMGGYDFDAFLPPDLYLDNLTLSLLELAEDKARRQAIPFAIVLLDDLDKVFNSLAVSRVRSCHDVSIPYSSENIFLPHDLHPNPVGSAKLARNMMPIVEELISNAA